MRKQYLTSIIMISISILLLIPTAIFAWKAFVERKSMAEFDIGQIVLTAEINDAPIVENITFDNLAYVDFTNDVVQNKYHMINNLATVAYVQIINGELSIPVKNNIQIVENVNQTGLLYLIIYDGKNMDPAVSQLPANCDFASRFSTIDSITPEPDEVLTRDDIDFYNQTVIDQISSNHLAPGEWLSLKIAVWGDYDVLDPLLKPTYLSQVYTLNLQITTSQIGME